MAVTAQTSILSSHYASPAGAPSNSATQYNNFPLCHFAGFGATETQYGGCWGGESAWTVKKWKVYLLVAPDAGNNRSIKWVFTVRVSTDNGVTFSDTGIT